MDQNASRSQLGGFFLGLDRAFGKILSSPTYRHSSTHVSSLWANMKMIEMLLINISAVQVVKTAPLGHMSLKCPFQYFSSSNGEAGYRHALNLYETPSIPV